MPVVIGASTSLQKIPRGAPVSYNSKLVKTGDIKIINFGREQIKVQYCLDGMWRDSSGCIWGFVDTQGTKDTIVRCGINIFSLSTQSPLTDACKKHDYAYQCPAVQDAYTREEIDKILLNDLYYIGKGHWYRVFAYPFYYLARIFGKYFWENSKTNS